jgi:hypothetical protein
MEYQEKSIAQQKCQRLLPSALIEQQHGASWQIVEAKHAGRPPFKPSVDNKKGQRKKEHALRRDPHSLLLICIHKVK